MTNDMRGISAVSQQDVLTAVQQVSTAGNDGEIVGSELFSVVALLDDQVALRRVLTDPSVESGAKEKLIGSVLTGQVSDPTLAVVKVAVSRRWAAGRDLGDGLEAGGVRAVVDSAAAAGQADRLEDELFASGEVVISDVDLRAVVTDRTIGSEPKARLLQTIFAGKVLDQTLTLLTQAARARTGSFERVLAGFGSAAAASQDQLVALVRVAFELNDDEKTRLGAALSRKYGKQVHLNIVVDPSVVGGVAVAVGDEVVDGTMSSRLETARRQLAG